MLEALKRLKNSVLSYVENAITDEVFDSWSPKKQKQWIKDHPNSKYASKDYKSSNKKGNKQTKSPTLKSKTLDKKQLSEIKKKVDKLWNVSDIEDMVSYELRGKDVDTKILSDGTYQVTWVSEEGEDGEPIAEALENQMRENYTSDKPIKVQLRHVNRSDWDDEDNYEYYDFTLAPINSIGKKELLKEIKRNPFSIKNIKNPSEELQLEAIKENDFAINYINKPTEKVKLLAIKKDPSNIINIKNPSEELQLEAVKKSGRYIEYIKNPSEKVQIEAIKNDEMAIKYIKNPSEKVQLEAIKTNPVAIKYIKKPCKKAIEYIKHIEKEKI